MFTKCLRPFRRFTHRCEFEVQNTLTRCMSNYMCQTQITHPSPSVECQAQVFLYIQQAPCNIGCNQLCFISNIYSGCSLLATVFLHPVIYPFLMLSLFPNLRFHVLSEFDDTKRSCRKRLAGHNERRRKSSSESNGEGSSHQRSTLQLNENQPGQAAGRGRTLITLPEDPTYKQFHVR